MVDVHEKELDPENVSRAAERCRQGQRIGAAREPDDDAGARIESLAAGASKQPLLQAVRRRPSWPAAE